MSNKVIHAIYNDDDILMDAVKQTRKAHHHIEEVFTPFPVHGLDKAMGLAPTRLDSIVFPRQIDVLSPSVNYYRWTLLQNATLTGATFAGTSPTGTVQYDLAATAISGGIEIQTGYASARELTQLSATDFFQFQLGRTLAGVSDVVTLALAATSNNADVLAELGWQELT